MGQKGESGKTPNNGLNCSGNAVCWGKKGEMFSVTEDKRGSCRMTPGLVNIVVSSACFKYQVCLFDQVKKSSYFSKARL